MMLSLKHYFKKGQYSSLTMLQKIILLLIFLAIAIALIVYFTDKTNTATDAGFKLFTGR